MNETRATWYVASCALNIWPLNHMLQTGWEPIAIEHGRIYLRILSEQRPEFPKSEGYTDVMWWGA